MDLLLANLPTVAAILAIMTVLAVVETVIPLQARSRWHRVHLGPNLALTLLTLATNIFLNTAVVLMLLWLEARGVGLLRWASLGPVVAGVLGVLVLDFSWYLLHAAMHEVPALWRIHRVHHSDPVVDVTTTVRQHPTEGLLRYATIALFACTFGIGVAAFTVYRAWSAINGLLEHTNVRLPRWLDRAWLLVSVSPSMHRIHHSRDVRETDSNYGNIFSFFDRLFATYTPDRAGRDVVCGLDGFDEPAAQTTTSLLWLPFQDRVPS